MSEQSIWSDSLERRRERAQWQMAVDRAYRERDLEPHIGAEQQGDLHAMIKAAAVEDLKECRWSREQVGMALTRILGREITVAQIDAVTAQTKIGHRFPADWIAAWVRVTGSRRILDLIAAEAGCWIADGDEHDLAEYGRGALRRDKLDDKLGALKKRLAEKV